MTDTSPHSMVVTAKVPQIFDWESLLTDFYKVSHAVQSKVVERQYAWLIQITSWAYNINWDPIGGTVTVSLPLSESLPKSINNFDTTQDNADLQLRLYRDSMSNLLIRILEDVPPRRVMSNFAQ